MLSMKISTDIIGILLTIRSTLDAGGGGYNPPSEFINDGFIFLNI